MVHGHGEQPVRLSEESQQAVEAALSTTRSVRRRLDLERPVERAELRACLEIATQAPSANHAEPWRFVVVTDASLRAEVGAVYRAAYDGLDRARAASEPGTTTQRVRSSSRYLAEVMARVPVQVACFVNAPFEAAAPLPAMAKFWASIYPAVWSLQVALRSRGLGSCLTTVGLAGAADIGRVLDVSEEWTLAALVAVGHVTGESFAPAARVDLDEVVTWR